MANYKQLSYGSTGDEVTNLQKKLNEIGNYNLDTDGIYGDKTRAAVKDYQQKNNLAVDGIAGKNTWDSLNSGLSSTASNALNNVAADGVNSAITDSGGEPPAKTPTTPPDSGFTYGDFTYNDFAGNDDPVVGEAWNILQQQSASKPGDYSPVWQDEADDYLSQYQNRDPFSYDLNSDALYQQYADMYTQQGQMAMMDAMGQAAAMTGGYGNSYAQTAGQQAYNQYLSQLNAVMPELYQMAHDRYTQEGQNMLDMYDLYMNKENYEYNKYQDALNNWYQEDSRNYQKERDEVADKQWQAEFDEAKRQADMNYNLSLQNSYKSGNTGTQYKDLSNDDRVKMQNDFDRAKTIDDVNYYANLYERMRYDPEIIKLMAQRAATRIAGGVTDTGVVSPLRRGTLSGANVTLK